MAAEAPNLESPLTRVRKAFLEKISKEDSLPEAIRTDLATLLSGGALPTEAQVLGAITRD
jgi:hypothetical protein